MECEVKVHTHRKTTQLLQGILLFITLYYVLASVHEMVVQVLVLLAVICGQICKYKIDK